MLTIIHYYIKSRREREKEARAVRREVCHTRLHLSYGRRQLFVSPQSYKLQFICYKHMII